MRRETPEPWASAMMEQGYTHAGRPSINGLADAAQRHTGTDHPSRAGVHKVVHGEVANPSPETISALAGALRLDVRTVARWVGQSWEDPAPWVPPEDAARLTRRQREALDNLIRVMVETEGRDGDADAAPNKRAGRAGEGKVLWPRGGRGGQSPRDALGSQVQPDHDGVEGVTDGSNLSSDQRTT